MCDWNNTIPLQIWLPANLSRTGEAGWEIRGVDSCIAPIVRALNDAGVVTVASCCGHGKRPSSIALVGGSEIIIAPDFKSARRIDLLFPPLNRIGYFAALRRRLKRLVG